MSKQQKIVSPLQDHLKFFIVFLVSFVMAESIMLLINIQLPGIFSALVVVFDNLTFPIVFLILSVLITRMISLILPEVNIDHHLSPVIPIGSILILVHPLLIQISGSTLSLNWLLLDIIREGQLLFWLVESLIYIVAGYFTYLILYRSPAYHKRYARYLDYAANDILTLIFIISITIYLVRSFISGDLSSITLTIPLKLILLGIFSIATTPIGSSIKEIQS